MGRDAPVLAAYVDSHRTWWLLAGTRAGVEQIALEPDVPYNPELCWEIPAELAERVVDDLCSALHPRQRAPGYVRDGLLSELEDGELYINGSPVFERDRWLAAIRTVAAHAPVPELLWYEPALQGQWFVWRRNDVHLVRLQPSPRAQWDALARWFGPADAETWFRQVMFAAPAAAVPGPATISSAIGDAAVVSVGGGTPVLAGTASTLARPAEVDDGNYDEGDGRQSFYVQPPVLEEAEALARKLDMPLGKLFWLAWEIGKTALHDRLGFPLATPAIVMPGGITLNEPISRPELVRSDERRKVALYLPERVLLEIQQLATDADESLSAIVDASFRIARERLWSAAVFVSR